MAPNKTSLPAVIQKELQRTIAVVCYKLITGKGSMKKTEMEGSLVDLFFGTLDANNISQVEQLLEGTGQYKTLFVEDTVQVNDTTLGSNCHKLLDKTFSRRPDEVFVFRRHITKSSIKQASASANKVVQLRTLWHYQEAACCNCKKAMSFAQVWCTSKTGNNDCVLPSGTCFANLYEHILAEMHTLLCNKGSVDKEIDLDCEIDQETNEATDAKIRPPDWFFPGYYTFLLFTKFQEDPTNCLNIFQDVEDEKSKQSQSENKKEVIKVEEKV